MNNFNFEPVLDYEYEIDEDGNKIITKINEIKSIDFISGTVFD